MRKFLLQTLFFVVAVGITLSLLEIALRGMPNRYRIKAHYMEQHADSIDVLIFGSSHAFMGIDPATFGRNAYNLANVSQSLDYDYLLLDKYLPRCKNLKRVIVSVSPFSLYSMLRESDRTLLQAYDTEFGLRPTPVSWKYRFEVFNPAAINKMIDCFKGDMIGMTPQGLSTRYSLENKKASGWDNGVERAESHTFSGPPLPELVTDLANMARLCQARKIELVVVTTPFMPSYTQHIDSVQWAQTIRTVDSLCARYDVMHYLNYFSDTTYNKTPDYFFDADHLTPQGAAVFSAALTDTLYVRDSNPKN